MTRKRLRMVLFGPQGCGKGTQGQLLADRFDVPLIGMGDLCRAEIESKSALGSLVKEYVERGMLAPDELVNGVAQKALKAINPDEGYILDGYPRNVEQAASLDRLMKLNLAIQLKLSDDDAVKRLVGRRQCTKCRSIFHLVDAPPVKPNACTFCGGALKQRGDDQEETIRKRLAGYHFMTEPMAAYYRQKGVLLAVHAGQPIPSLFDELTKKMAKLGFNP